MTTMTKGSEHIDRVFDFLRTAEGLKSVLRYASTTSGRKESVADHSWRVALMAFVVGDGLGLKIDFSRAMKMAIVHDIAESIAGDIDFVRISDGEVTREEKRSAELVAMTELKETLSGSAGEELYAIWKEYDAGETEVARYVRAIDKLETLTQLVESGHSIYDRPELIANYADVAVAAFPELTPMLRALKGRLHEEFDKGSFDWKPGYDV
ncbi:MAG: HD domain-containing protein [Candidatus Moraniibacteriota bacterium]